nr:hypothetical protein [Angustibacter aerolatus]
MTSTGSKPSLVDEPARPGARPRRRRPRRPARGGCRHAHPAWRGRRRRCG